MPSNVFKWRRERTEATQGWQSWYKILAMDWGIGIQRIYIWVLTLLFRDHISWRIIHKYWALILQSKNKSPACFIELFNESVLVNAYYVPHFLWRLIGTSDIRQGMWLRFNAWTTSPNTKAKCHPLSLWETGEFHSTSINSSTYFKGISVCKNSHGLF